MRRNPTANEVYSPSRLASFEDCPRKFHYRYVQKLPVETESIEAFVGKRVHEVLERLYQFTHRGMVPSLARVLDRFRALWDEAWEPERIRIVREGLEPQHYRANGERCLTNYYRRHYPFDHGETLGVDQLFRALLARVLNRVRIAPVFSFEGLNRSRAPIAALYRGAHWRRDDSDARAPVGARSGPGP